VSLTERTIGSPRIGFSCEWWTPREPTWSYTPAYLLRALQRRGEPITSIETQRSLPLRAALAMAYRPTSMPWKYSNLNQRLAARAMRAQAAAGRCEAVISTADETFDAGVPTFVYQDMNFEVARASSELLDPRLLSTLATTRARLRQVAARQAAQYDKLAGIFAMSTWFRDELIGQGIPSTAIEVVGAGLTSLAAAELRGDTRQRTRLLFVGGEFERKGGDQVLAAVERLRGEGGLPITLTVVGPPSWPGQAEPPSWVRYIGAMPPSAVAQLFCDHDLFVMPSRFEAYGIALLEAQAAGLPCVARRAFAMSELVPEGRGGMLIEEDDGADELATTIEKALDDDSLYENIRCRAREVRITNTWDAVAERMVRAIQRRVAT
jgi:hypothetical protein